MVSITKDYQKVGEDYGNEFARTQNSVHGSKRKDRRTPKGKGKAQRKSTDRCVSTDIRTINALLGIKREKHPCRCSKRKNSKELFPAL